MLKNLTKIILLFSHIFVFAYLYNEYTHFMGKHKFLSDEFEICDIVVDICLDRLHLATNRVVFNNGTGKCKGQF